MVRGVGADILRIERMKRPMENPAFVKRVFTESEIGYIRLDSAGATERAAGIFCAKEAVVKALGTGFTGAGPSDVEIDHDERGAPQVTLHGKAFEGVRLHVSITHDGDYAAAFAVAEEE